MELLVRYPYRIYSVIQLIFCNRKEAIGKRRYEEDH